ncbi:hypothetical protein PV08_04731 [Exophiala spinifera]|uniref:AB hydrolase-1 domain-containing protein n=1 Tax=Exophiala spinifera TaxID=91928 RepID=A0A0D1ZY44_9EURO|nr:uncharacterized protein PV08_04731 [Exophiala spinifera]KIW17537.1 hypothetical protein PV08_04731 [Exophiala spinifera]
MPTFKVSRGFEYSYIIRRPVSAPKGWLLFLHGYPSIAHEWHYQLDHFHNAGYGVIAPDLLGSGHTSRPAEVEAYLYKDMAKDVVEILDHEAIDRVFAVGHDVGSLLLARLAVYFPERVEKLGFVAVGYRPPGAPVSVDRMNEMTAKVIGYPAFGYQVFFTRNPDAEVILNQHKESLLSLQYAQDPSLWKDHMCPVGAVEEWVLADRQAAWGEFLTEEDHRVRREETADELGGLPTLAWYKAAAWNLNYEVEKDLAEEAKYLHQPTIYITCANDYIAVPRAQLPQMTPWVPNLEVKELDTGHWAFLQRPEVVNEALEAFFSK